MKSGGVDGTDLPSLSSFIVDDGSCFCGSFRFARLKMNSITTLFFSGIDLPSLKSIHLGDGGFYYTSGVEITSKDETRR